MDEIRRKMIAIRVLDMKVQIARQEGIRSLVLHSNTIICTNKSGIALKDPSQPSPPVAQFVRIPLPVAG
jgi:hypothetical protein